MVRSEKGYILKAFTKTKILDKNDFRTKMPSKYLQLKHGTNSLRSWAKKCTLIRKLYPAPTFLVQRQQFR